MEHSFRLQSNRSKKFRGLSGCRRREGFGAGVSARATLPLQLRGRRGDRQPPVRRSNQPDRRHWTGTGQTRKRPVGWTMGRPADKPPDWTRPVDKKEPIFRTGIAVTVLLSPLPRHFGHCGRGRGRAEGQGDRPEQRPSNAPRDIARGKCADLHLRKSRPQTCRY